MTKEEKLARKQQRKTEKVGLGKLILWNSSSCSVALSTLMLGYVTFYCTDVLQLAPALVGTLFMVSKILTALPISLRALLSTARKPAGVRVARMRFLCCSCGCPHGCCSAARRALLPRPSASGSSVCTPL